MSENNNQKSRVAQLALRNAMAGMGSNAQPEFVEFALGAGAVSANHAWVVVLEQCDRSLGPVLLWAQKFDATSLDIFVVSDADIIARRAELFDLDIRIWLVADKKVSIAESAAVLATSQVPQSHEQFADLIAQSGAEVVREHGVLSG